MGKTLQEAHDTILQYVMSQRQKHDKLFLYRRCELYAAGLGYSVCYDRWPAYAEAEVDPTTKIVRFQPNRKECWTHEAGHLFLHQRLLLDWPKHYGKYLGNRPRYEWEAEAFARCLMPIFGIRFLPQWVKNPWNPFLISPNSMLPADAMSAELLIEESQRFTAILEAA